MDDFLNSLRRAGKSELTVKQYKNTLMRFTEWLSGDPHPTPRTPQENRRKGSDIYAQNFNISNTSETQRSCCNAQRSTKIKKNDIDSTNTTKYTSQGAALCLSQRNTVISNDAFEYSNEGSTCLIQRDDVDTTDLIENHRSVTKVTSGQSEKGVYSIYPLLQTLLGVTELDVADFKRWAIQRYQSGTVKVMLTQLKVFYRWLNEAGQVPDNPVKTVKTITVVKQAPKWLTRKEQNQLIWAVRKYGNFRELTLVTLMLHTGLRVQEVANVCIVDIEIGERKGKVTVRNGKHNRRREVPLNIDCREVLKRYLQDNTGLEYLFPNKTGNKITTRSLQSVIEKYRKLTGIEHLNAHSLRHSFCHELVSRKIPLDVVARLAGHVKQDGSPNIQQTLVYTQPGEDDLQRVVEELSWR